MKPAKTCVPGGKSKSPVSHFWYQEWGSLFSLICLRRAACLIGQYGSGEYFAEVVDVQGVEDRDYGRGGRRETDRVYGVPGVMAAQKTGPG